MKVIDQVLLGKITKDVTLSTDRATGIIYAIGKQKGITDSRELDFLRREIFKELFRVSVDKNDFDLLEEDKDSDDK